MTERTADSAAAAPQRLWVCAITERCGRRTRWLVPAPDAREAALWAMDRFPWAGVAVSALPIPAAAPSPTPAHAHTPAPAPAPATSDEQQRRCWRAQMQRLREQLRAAIPHPLNHHHKGD